MYTLKVSYGDVDEPETATVEYFGAYETWEDACDAAQSKFDEIVHYLSDIGVPFGEAEASLHEYYITNGDYDHYYMVNVVKR